MLCFYGAVPVARPTSLAAELWGVLQALRHSGMELVELITDCAGVVKRAHQRQGLGHSKWTTPGTHLVHGVGKA